VAVDAGIAQLTGELEQRPPTYSAKQVGGRRAHAAARRGAPLEVPPSRVVVHEWRIRARRAESLDVTITCGGGTYVRALARDLGRLSRSAAHLTTLRRTRSGPFDVADAVTLDRQTRPALRPALDAVGALAVDVLTEDALRLVIRGRAVPAGAPGARAALVDASRTLVAVAEREGDRWQPRVVMRDG
jgi:tRNA pseudouridine55 synthase